MSTPRRRSWRIRNETPARPAATPLNKLSSLLERDDSPPSGAPPNIDALVSSPVAPPNTIMSQIQFGLISSPMKTPQTASRLYPSLEEMHPSKVHQNTIKQSLSHQGVDSITSRTARSPSKSTMAAVTQQTPTKSTGLLPGHMASPTFDFGFERPESDLSVEAQKIMNSVREEAAKIKAQMLEERSKQEDKDGETDQLYGVGGRKINKAKGKSGRYSDVHKEEFKKMDSITSHASLWKTRIQDSTASLKRSPSKPSPDEFNTSPLKRSPCKAGLDQLQKPLVRMKSPKSLAGLNESRERLENTASGKRAKLRSGDDTSAARPMSRDTNSEAKSARTTPAQAEYYSGLPSAVTTPTKASIARSLSVKHVKTSMIPSLSRSASTKTLNGTAVPKSEPSNKYLSSLSRFGSMKSILHRSQPKFSDDPMKIAGGTHLPLPTGKVDLEKGLPSLPSTPSMGFQCSPTIKHVAFSASTSYPQEMGADTPSPSKIPTPNGKFQPEMSTSAHVDAELVTYPVLANSPNVTTRTKITKASTPGDFTFRADKTINFSPSKDATVTSPGSTIRHVRPSGVPTTHAPTFGGLPVIPHGMPNKKRRRPESDTEAEDGENVDPMVTDESDEDQPRAKRHCISASPEKDMDTQSPLKRRVGGSRIPKFGGAKERGRKALTLGRLNMLARPKERR